MLQLKAGLTRNPRFEPLVEGAVRPREISLDCTITSPPELFYRNLKYDEFDVFEMSISEMIMTKELGGGNRWQWSALPIFPAKAFIWLDLFVNTSAGICDLGELKGKRVGVPDYVMTASLWFRIYLKELYAIRPRDISWYIGRAKEFSHGAILGMDPLAAPQVSIGSIAPEQTFDAMLERGEIDAAYGFLPRHDPKILSFGPIDRYGGTPVEGNPRMGRLFLDRGRAIVTEFYRRAGVTPANHLIAVQNRILERHPWVAMELYQAFSESKRAAYERTDRQSSAYLLFEGDDPGSQAATFGEDPYPFGIKENRGMLELLFRNSHEDGLTRKLARIEGVFYAATLDT